MRPEETYLIPPELYDNEKENIQKPKNWSKFYTFSAFLLFILWFWFWSPNQEIPPAALNDPAGRLTRVLPVSHAFIVSAYYYPTSKSLGQNAVALNLAADVKNFNMENVTFNIIGSNSSDQQLSVASSEIQGIPSCRYQTLMAKTNTVGNLKKLELESNGVKVKIPFRMARYKAPKPVIICISPQFVAEQWQMFLMHVHVAHRFGGHMHVYLTSIIESFFDLMSQYEQHGYLTLDFWLRMKFSKSETPFFEPNGNVEWRNQAGAETDCLLQYKEAAEFIAFFDMDDILFPKTYPTYQQEFTAEWANQPNATSLLYGRREHEFVKDEQMMEFNFTNLVANLRSSPVVKRGKVVIRPENYNSTWIHYSQHEDEFRRHCVESPNLVHVQRPLDKNGDNNVTKLWHIDFGPLNETIRSEDVAAIQEDVQMMKLWKKTEKIAQKLPASDFYLPIVFKCYYDAFYGPILVEKTGTPNCPNADFCQLPQRPEYKCVHSDAEYHSGPHMTPFTFHFSDRPFWNWHIGCYQ